MFYQYSACKSDDDVLLTNLKHTRHEFFAPPPLAGLRLGSSRVQWAAIAVAPGSPGGDNYLLKSSKREHACASLQG